MGNGNLGNCGLGRRHRIHPDPSAPGRCRQRSDCQLSVHVRDFGTELLAGRSKYVRNYGSRSSSLFGRYLYFCAIGYLVRLGTAIRRTSCLRLP